MSAGAEHQEVLRFDGVDRISHALLIVAFLGLSISGLPLLFSHAAWAGHVARLLGGFQSAGWIHRVCALLLIGVFAIHIFRVLQRVLVRREYGLLWGPASMTPQPRDLFQMIGHIKYFLGMGPRPKFDHFTYWEKFDYWAVFWGMFVIGGSGLVLWFPTIAARVLPGWMLNIALLIHGEEALLATGFIFTIHFFNENFRPSRFPMNTVMFTGRESVEEIAHLRPAEYERYRKSAGEGWKHIGPPEDWVLRWGRVFGGAALLTGVSLLALILYAVFS